MSVAAEHRNEPPGTVRWETYSSDGANGRGRVAVDTYGRRWHQHDGKWRPVPKDYVSPQVWREHIAGCNTANEESYQQMNPTTTAPTTTSPAPATAASVSEVTSVRGLIARLEEIAQAHAAVAGNEGFLGSLQRMDVGTDDQQRFLAAQEASRNAEAAWKTAADSVRRNNDPVGEAYRQSPGAANKQANTNE